MPPSGLRRKNAREIKTVSLLAVRKLGKSRCSVSSVAKKLSKTTEHGTTEHTEHTELRTKKARLPFRVFRVFRGYTHESPKNFGTSGTRRRNCVQSACYGLQQANGAASKRWQTVGGTVWFIDS